MCFLVESKLRKDKALQVADRGLYLETGQKVQYLEEIHAYKKPIKTNDGKLGGVSVI